MSESIYRVTEVIGTSTESWEDATRHAVETAARTMTEAVRMSAPEQVTAGKQRADFDARMSSTQAQH